MNVEPNGRRRRYGRMLRLVPRSVGGALLLFAVLIGSAALILLLSSRSVPVAGILRVGGTLLLVLSPVLVFGVVACLPRGFRAARRRIGSRAAG